MKLFPSALGILALSVLASSALANDINLPPEKVKACVERASTVVRSHIQLSELAINGHISDKTTFDVRTPLALYRGDVDTADVVAFCSRAGTETISIMMELKNPESTRYHVNVQVSCLPCF
jgi:hypothetical protein